MKIIDSHAHLNFRDFDEDREELIEKTIRNGVWMINVGCDYETGKRAVEIAEDYEEGVYASVGLHPGHLVESDEFNRESYRLLAQSKKVVAIGETGLDYYYRPKNKGKRDDFENRQKSIFIEHLDLAEELDLPVIIHCRSAHKDMIEILREREGKVRGVIHCFTGDWKDALNYLDMGFLIGFTGIIFKLNLNEIIEKIPLNGLLVETDCPYLTPPSKSGRNEPLYVKEVIDKIAELRGLDSEEITQVTTANAKRLFGI